MTEESDYGRNKKISTQNKNKFSNQNKILHLRFELDSNLSSIIHLLKKNFIVSKRYINKHVITVSAEKIREQNL